MTARLDAFCRRIDIDNCCRELLLGNLPPPNLIRCTELGFVLVEPRDEARNLIPIIIYRIVMMQMGITKKAIVAISNIYGYSSLLTAQYSLPI